MTLDELVQARFSRPHAWSLADQGGRCFDVTAGESDVLCHVEAGARTIFVDGEPVQMGQVAWVCTDPDYEGLSLAQSLIRAAIRWMGDQGAQYVGLFADITRFYGQLGFVAAPNLGEWGMVRPVLLESDAWNQSAAVDLQGDVW